MRTSAPTLLPLFRSEMQVHLLALLTLQPERTWTLQELAGTLASPQSSVHRELGRALRAGIICRDSAARPHRFRAATDDAFQEPLAELLRLSVGVEERLRAALDRPDVDVATIHGSWVSGARRPNSDIDVLVVGDADLRTMRRLVRPIGKSVGRTIDLTVMAPAEFRNLIAHRASFAQRLFEGPTTPLIGELASIART